MSQLTDQFIDALQRLESSRDGEGLAALFSDDAEIASPLVHHESGGASAAAEFWTHYRDAFDDIRSTFKTVREIDGIAFLEWQSQGSMDGQSFTYEGVSVLEETDGKITAFRTYFDTRHLPVATKPPGGEAAKGDGEGKDEAAPEGDLEQAQRDAAEQRADGGYA